MRPSDTIRILLLAGCIALALGLADPAAALLGSAESAPFPLNTKALSGVRDEAPLPLVDLLLDCRPNPFNPSTTIAFELGGPTPVRLQVYDLQGRLVRTLVAGTEFPAGRHGITWNGRDLHDRSAASGVYFYRLVTTGYSETRSMTLVK